MARTDAPHGAAPIPPDDAEVIDLEPTVLYQPGAGASPEVASGTSSAADPSVHMALVTGPEVSLTSETQALLRSRLGAAALFLGGSFAAMMVFALAYRDSVFALALPSFVVRILVSLGLVALLRSRVDLSLRALRNLETGYFGLMTALLIGTQYVLDLRLIELGDLPRLIAVEKNGILSLFAMMIIYGVFIPNSPAATARVVLTMALGPLVVLAGITESKAQQLEALDHLTGHQVAVSNVLLVLIGAALAIYSSYVLNGLRRDLRNARKLGQYQLGEKLGEGGMGEVYLAEHDLLKRPCALKLIKPDVNTNPMALARFEREVKTSAMLSHPNTISIYDYGHTDDGTFYYVMEYLPGLSVGDLVRQFGPLEPARAVYLARQVCGALSEAHRMGLIHRDLKPANIHVAILGGQCDVAKVLDYGLVKLTEPGVAQLTADYTVSGTPQYMSPEQATGQDEFDGRADLYSLGAVLYFMLTGTPPFEGKNAMELMIAHARDAVVAPSERKAGIPADLEAVVVRCLSKSPEARFADARALSDALGACACAEDWGPEKAEGWWAEQAVARLQAGPPAAVATA